MKAQLLTLIWFLAPVSLSIAQSEKLEATVLSKSQRENARGMLDRDLRARRDRANAQNRAEWKKITTRAQWLTYSRERLQRLKKSLGDFPPPPKKLNVRVTRSLVGEGFVVENILYESHKDQWVPCNLYRPKKPSKSMPGLILVHSHHRHRKQGELQDMGMTWARKGCMVLVIDQVGYGERRAHPFHSAKDYAKEYKSWRQDYYHRYDSGIQLQLAGDSLMGWMVYDLMRGVDLLLSRPGIDPNRIVILGAVAGGGDPCAITAALDQRIKGAVPFNFGGAQPETRYPLPPDAEKTFNYLGGTYWDSTRGLRLGGDQGFFHWTIVGSIAPRPLIYAHEFKWHQKNDPVWNRFGTIWGFFDAKDKLGSLQGYGSVRLSSKEASHCTNIGKYHRKFIHPLFKKWFNIDVKPEDEYRNRRSNDELSAWNADARKELKPKGFLERVSAMGRQHITKMQRELTASPKRRRQILQKHWRTLLGTIEPQPTKTLSQKRETHNKVIVDRVVLEVEKGILVPLMILRKGKKVSPVVVAVAQGGKEGFLKHRGKEITSLLDRGVAVCLPDVRGTGETKSGTSRGRRSGDGNRSVNLLLYGGTMLGQRLRDVRAVIGYLRSRKDVDGKRIAMWGDSFAQTNSAKGDFKIPRGVSGRPTQSEPLGGLLALFTALYEENILAVFVQNGLASYHSVLTAPQVLIPHDVVVPWALRAGDLPELVSGLGSTSICLTGMVDHLNRKMSSREVERIYRFARKAKKRLVIGDKSSVVDFLTHGGSGF